MSATGNETLEEQQNIGQQNDFERFVDSACQNQVIENIIDDKIKRAVNNAVFTVKKCMHEAILTAMDEVLIPKIEIVVKSITGSSGHGINSEVQNPNRRDFLGNADNTTLVSASSRLDLNTNQDRIDEARNKENFEDGDFPALRSNYDRKAQAHHSNWVTRDARTFTFSILLWYLESTFDLAACMHAFCMVYLHVELRLLNEKTQRFIN